MMKTMTNSICNMPFRSGLSTRDSENEKSIECYFARFDDTYEIGDWYKERLDKNVFNRTLIDSPDIRCLVDHNTNLVLGRTKSGTLNLEVDNIGLKGVVRINEHDADAVNLYERVKRGDVDGCSFGFNIVEDERAEDGTYLIRDIDLYEVSICTFPAYEKTNAQARHASRSDAFEQKRKQLLEKIRRGN